jgi:hypothetical protein
LQKKVGRAAPEQAFENKSVRQREALRVGKQAGIAALSTGLWKTSRPGSPWRKPSENTARQRQGQAFEKLVGPAAPDTSLLKRVSRAAPGSGLCTAGAAWQRREHAFETQIALAEPGACVLENKTVWQREALKFGK